MSGSSHSVRSHPSPGPIEPGSEGTPERDEFDPITDWDSSQLSDVASYVYEHCYENGRRYHAYKHGRYPVPNDDQEQDREDMKHAMLMEVTVRGRLSPFPLWLSPLPPPSSCLSILFICGRGVWVSFALVKTIRFGHGVRLI